MDKPTLGFQEILEIIKCFETLSEFSEFYLKSGDIEVSFRKQGAEGLPMGAPRAPDSEPLSSAPMRQKAAETMPPKVEPPVAPPSPAVSASPQAFLIKSPTVGTFYCAPEPGAAPFVSVGQKVSPDTTVCIVEVMKLMNAIQAGCHGVVSQILVKDSEAVEFGQTLIVVDRG